MTLSITNQNTTGIVPILTITGLDNSGCSGLLLDTRTITEMGGHALAAPSCIVLQDKSSIKESIDFPSHVIRKQISSVIADYHPKAIKVGLVKTTDAAKAIAEEIVACRRIVLAPGIMSSNGTLLIDDDTIEGIKYYLIPKATLLILRCDEAEKILSMRIATNEDMILAAQRFISMGAENVMLRGGKIAENRLAALLYSTDTDSKSHTTFFSTYNIEGWQQHGVGGALSAAIATRLAIGDDISTAISNAHEFVHSRIVYSVKTGNRRLRPSDIYNEFLNLLSNNYQHDHSVTFYADRLHITPRYLSQITSDTVMKTPKQIIAEYLMHEARLMLENSRMSIKETASALGFPTTAMFCKFFKQQQGITPSEYRLSAESLS